MIKEYVEVATNKTTIENFINYANYSEEDKLTILKGIYATKIIVEKRRSHKKDAISVNAFAVFIEIYGKKINISKKDFYLIYNAFFVSELNSGNKKYDKKIMNALNPVLNLQLDFDDFFRGIVSLTSSYSEVDKVVVNISSKYMNYTRTELFNVFFKAYKDLSKVKMLHSELRIAVISYLFDFYGNPDYFVEDSFILRKYVLNSQYDESNILLVLPSVSFLNAIIKNYKGSIIVVLDDKLLLPYRERCLCMPNFHFLSIEDMLSNNNYYRNIDNLMVFNHRVGEKTEKIRIISKSLELLSENGYLHIFDSDYDINRVLKAFENETDVYLESFIFFPSGIRNDKNQLSSRRTLVTLRINNVETIQVHKYSISEDDKHIMYLVKKPYVLKIERKQFLILNNTLRNEYNKYELQLLTKTDRHLTKAEKIEFTSELSLYLTTSQSAANNEIRLNAYIRNLENEKIEHSIKSKHMQVDDGIEKYNWVTTVYPYQTVTHSHQKYSIRELIINNYINELKVHDVTLKTLYYLLPENETKFLEEIQKFRSMLFSSYFGDLLTADLTDDVLINYFDSSGISNQEKILFSKMIISLLNMAIDRGFNVVNNLSNGGLDIQKKYDDIRKVRQGLMKSYLLKEEMSSLISILEERILKKDVLAVGVMMSIYTGLDSNIICALKWKDFQMFGNSLNGVPMYRLNIRRQLRNDGSEYVHFDEVKSYRLFPIATCLANILIARKMQLLNKGILENQLMEMPILQRSQTVSNSMYSVCAPVTLNKYIKKLIENDIKISELVINLPLKGGGTVETNLNQYKGNILKSNFQHYCMYKCAFLEGELEFLMGKEASQTLSKHYLDYRNNEVQMILWEKLNRLPYSYKPRKTKKIKKLNNNCVSDLVSNNEGKSNLKIEFEFEESIQIMIKNNYGFHVEVVEVTNDDI